MSKTPIHKPRRPKHRTPPKEATRAPIDTPNDWPEEEAAEIPADIERDQRHAMIAQHAYYLAEQRGFEPGHELDDWLAAERNVEQAAAPHRDEAPTLCGD